MERNIDATIQGITFKECLFVVLVLLAFQSIGYAVVDVFLHPASAVTELRVALLVLASVLTTGVALWVAGKRLTVRSVEGIALARLSRAHALATIVAGMILGYLVVRTSAFWPGPELSVDDALYRFIVLTFAILIDG